MHFGYIVIYYTSCPAGLQYAIAIYMYTSVYNLYLYTYL